MQRSFPYQNVINQLFIVGLYLIYISLSSIYLLLPPLLALLFFAYINALKKHDLFTLLIVSVMLLIFEAEKGFWFGSSILFFTLISLFIIPKLEQIVQCQICMAGILVAFAYPGYWLFMWIINQVLMLAPPAIDWQIILYSSIEFLVIAALL